MHGRRLMHSMQQEMAVDRSLNWTEAMWNELRVPFLRLDFQISAV